MKLWTGLPQYLSGLGDRPVLAQTKPGELFDALPASAPAKGESFCGHHARL